MNPQPAWLLSLRILGVIVSVLAVQSIVEEAWRLYVGEHAFGLSSGLTLLANASFLILFTPFFFRDSSRNGSVM